ncbi:hypothetical protein [Actinacidiphila acidipaludis]|uniref:Lipoprotein n=1 Tax=Actinacidiphila acidipaludis TaxID=2873382 RepID=A0ABS7Q7P4_9ACTN|nr:hypothetical protein [Streptomyces acidipaludis]MBY8879176.1 hypothetical protein [Streptomyces acidipaludis]
MDIRPGNDLGGPRPGGRATGSAPVLAFFLAMALALGLAAAAAGCDGTGGDSARQGGGHGAAGGAGTSPANTPGAGAVPSVAELKSALLTAHDIGLGSTVDPSSIGGASIRGCEPLAGTLNASMAAASRPGQPAASSGIAGSGTGPFVAEALTTKAPSQLAADYARTRAALSACRSLTLTTGGTRVTFALTPTSFGGSGTASAQLAAKVQGLGVHGYLAMERLGPVVLSYYFFELGGSSSEPASTFYRQAVAKAGRVLAVPASGQAG